MWGHTHSPHTLINEKVPPIMTINDSELTIFSTFIPNSLKNPAAIPIFLMFPQRKMYLVLCILRGHVYNFFWGRMYIFMGTCVKDTQMSPHSYVTDSLYCNHVVYVTASYDPKTCNTYCSHNDGIISINTQHTCSTLNI